MLEQANRIPPTICLFGAHIHLHVTQFKREYTECIRQISIIFTYKKQTSYREDLSQWQMIKVEINGMAAAAPAC